jgi:hypothetical protein
MDYGLSPNAKGYRWFLFLRRKTSIAQRTLAPAGMWSDISALATAGGADKLRLEIRQPHVIRPSVTADCDVVAAAII